MPASFTETLLDLLSPMRYSGAEDLDIFLGALGLAFEQTYDWASDTDDGKPGYSLLVDADRVPDEAIPWLAQFVGVPIVTGMDPSDQRASLKGLGSWKRGTVTALEAAAAPYLTGAKTLIVKERDSSAYHFEVITLDSETPDSAVVLAALLTQKPAGLVMNYIVYAGQNAFTMRDSILRGTVKDTLRFAL